MNKLAYVLIATVTLTGAPRAAVAQVYPERVRVGRPSPRGVLPAARAATGKNRSSDPRRRFAIGASGELDVANIAGDITVTRGSGTDADRRGDQDGARALGRGCEGACSRSSRSTSSIARDVRRSGRAIPRATRSASNRRNINVSVSYNITAPVNTRLTAKSISGNIKVTDIKGDVTAESVSGDVRIGGSGRVGIAKSVSGNVEVVDTQIDGTLEAGSVSGDVILRRLTARRIDTSSISGTVRMEDVQCDRVDAQSISGVVAFSGPLARKGGRYALKSHSGEVTVAIAGGIGFEVDASSFSGQVRSDLPITTRMGSIRDGVSGRSLAATATAAPSSNLTTFSGNVVITKR